MKKGFNFLIICLLFTCLSSIHAKPLNSEFSYYLDPSQNQQLLHQTFSTFQCGTSSHQDSFYSHQNHVQTKLHTCWILKSKEQCFLIQPEDANLIDKICIDNPHKSFDTLRTSLARNPAINDIQNFYAHQNKSESDGFELDIFIDKKHFKNLANSKQRIKNLEKSARSVMDTRHALEVKNLKSKHKNEKHAAKKHSKSQQNKIKKNHEQELAALEIQHAQEDIYYLGRKNHFIQKPTESLQITQVQITKKSLHDQQIQITLDPVLNIPLQELQILYDEMRLVACNGHNSFKIVMHSRSAALIESLQNQTITTQTVQLKNETVGFMQAHNIDSTIFTQSSGLAINHQISHEMIDVMDQLAYHASHHFNNDFIQKGSLICSEMATMAQQENHLNHTSESISAANCSHGLLHYVKGMASDGLQRCDQMLQAIDYYTLEMNKYVISAAKGVAQGIITAEITTVTMSALSSVASTCAPALTATISSCASAAAVPIACTAAVVATTVIIGETTQLGYFYATDQMNKFNNEINRVKDFAANFYDFNQTKYEHVENISQAATTLLWPVKSQAIIDSLQGICNAQVHFYVQGKKVIEKTARVSQDILESAIKKVNSLEFKEFNASYKKIFGHHLFEFSAPPQVALAGMSETFVKKEIVSLIPTTNLFNESTNKVTEKIIGGIVTQVAQNSAGQKVLNDITSFFLDTPVGKKMQKLITKNYEQNAFDKVKKEYAKLILYETPQELVDQFLRCCEVSSVPTLFRTELDLLQNEFINKDYAETVMQLRHIFYPKLTPKFNENYQTIKQFTLEGFHHDEYGSLEKSGLFKFVTKTYGDVTYGAEECFIGVTDWGNGIICNKDKTFFPSSWSKEKTAQVIFEANKNRIKILDDTPSRKQFECKGPNNLIVEIVIDSKNTIISAYPSLNNFIGLS